MFRVTPKNEAEKQHLCQWTQLKDRKDSLYYKSVKYYQKMQKLGKDKQM